MRYFYYGADRNRRQQENGRCANTVSAEHRGDETDSDLVIEEDTVYEIDRACEACRRRAGSNRWL